MKNTMNEQMRTLLAGSCRAAVYCRLSKDDDLQGESASIANQRAMLENYCEQQGWEVVEVYQDDSYTGLNMERPALQRILEAQKGQFTGCLAPFGYRKDPNDKTTC